ncbi:hypothetical protein DMENIID0001_092170 [Sergentomyia squamirostris]
MNSAKNLKSNDFLILLSAILHQQLSVASVIVANKINQRNHTKIKKKPRKNREYWVSPLLQERALYGCNLLRSIWKSPNDQQWLKFTRLNCKQFQILLNLIEPIIAKNPTRVDVIPAAIRLAITLRFLATGDSYESLGFLFYIHESTISNIVDETTNAIWLILKDLVFKPFTEESIKAAARSFEKWTLFPNVAGSIDGKHVYIMAPAKSGSTYRNYKQCFSVVLLAMCDGDYRFTYVNVGNHGSTPDGSSFRNSKLFNAIEKGSFPFPSASPTQFSGNTKWPFVILGDGGFGLQPYLMTPYSSNQSMNCDAKAFFNNQLSKGRTLIERTFGILAQRWKIFSKRIELSSVTKIEQTILSAVALHNFLLCFRDVDLYLNEDFSAENENGSSLNEHVSPEPEPLLHHQSSLQAVRLRDHIKDYLFSLKSQVME